MENMTVGVRIDYAKATLRALSKQNIKRNCTIICGGQLSDRQICFEHEGKVNCPMCSKTFDDLVALINHMICARQNNLNVLECLIGFPDFEMRVDNNNPYPTLLSGEAAHQNLQPAVGSMLPFVDIASAHNRIQKRAFDGRNARVICGQKAERFHICIERDGPVKCSMCAKVFENYVDTINHMMNARVENSAEFKHEIHKLNYKLSFSRNAGTPSVLREDTNQGSPVNSEDFHKVLRQLDTTAHQSEWGDFDAGEDFGMRDLFQADP